MPRLGSTKSLLGKVQDPQLEPVKKHFNIRIIITNSIYLELNSLSDTSSGGASLIPGEQHRLEQKNESEMEYQEIIRRWSNDSMLELKPGHGEWPCSTQTHDPISEQQTVWFGKV